MTMKEVMILFKFREGTYGYNMLTMFAMCGEFPYHSLYMAEGEDRIVKRAVLNLKKEKYITVVGKGQAKSIRLTKKGIEKLHEIDENMEEHYLEMTDGHKYRGGKDAATIVWRRHRIAEIILMMKFIGADVWTCEKPELNISTQDKRIHEDSIVYYTSREIKNADKDQKHKTEFTRIMGMLFSPGGVYGIYNTNHGLIKWNTQGEAKAQVLMEDIISFNYSQNLNSVDSCIMFGKDIDVARRILESRGGPRDANNFEILSFDNTYPNIHFIPIDGHGMYQLNLLIQANWHDAIKYSIFPENYLDTEMLSIDCDAYDGEDKYILSFLDGNIGRLKRFKESMYGDAKHEVVCFDWQAEMVSQYAPGCTIKEVTEEKLSEMIRETFS